MLFIKIHRSNKFFSREELLSFYFLDSFLNKKFNLDQFADQIEMNRRSKIDF